MNQLPQLRPESLLQKATLPDAQLSQGVYSNQPRVWIARYNDPVQQVSPFRLRSVLWIEEY